MVYRDHESWRILAKRIATALGEAVARNKIASLTMEAALPRDLKEYKVFIASPGNLQPERTESRG